MTDKEVIKALRGKIEMVEQRFVACLWKNPENFYDIDDYEYSDFLDNKWGTLFYMGKDMVCNLSVKVITEHEIEIYLSSHKKKKKVWESLKSPDKSSYSVVMSVIESLKGENYIMYYNKLQKYKVVNKLINEGLLDLTSEKLEELEELSLDDFYHEYELKMNNAFTSISSNVKTYSICDGIDENIKSWYEGSAMGLILDALPEFSKQVGGIPKGDITLLGGVSNAGKSTILRNCIIPMFLLNDEEIEFLKHDNDEEDEETIEQQKIRQRIDEKKTVIFLNEEDISKWQRELLVYVASTYMTEFDEKAPDRLNKNIIRNGGKIFNQTLDKWKEQTRIDQAKEILKERTQRKNLLIMPLPKFSTSLLIKYIKKYASLGYMNFIIDTFKMDNTDDSKIDNNTRLQLVQNMTHLYNVAKKQGGKDVRVVCTVQLAKAQMLTRYLSQEALAESKNMIDVCACGLFLRKVWEDEKTGGLKPIKVYDYNDINKEIALEIMKDYIIIFPVKTREGELNRQCVCEVNWNTNAVKEIGFTRLQPINV